jgi:hypothetical protein
MIGQQLPENVSRYPSARTSVRLDGVDERVADTTVRQLAGRAADSRFRQLLQSCGP